MSLPPLRSVCTGEIFQYEAPSELERFFEAYVEAFPQEAKGIRDFVSDCLAIRTEASRAEQGTDPLRPGRFPLLLRYRRATLAEVLAAHVADPAASQRARGALALPRPPALPRLLPLLRDMLMSYVADGTYYCRGTFQTLAEALVEALLRRDGELVLRSPVRRILVEGGCVAGVVLESGQRIAAPLVISNALGYFGGYGCILIDITAYSCHRNPRFSGNISDRNG